MKKVYYQPNLSDKEWYANKWFNTIDVYHSFDNAKRDFPNAEIGAYSGDDIENPNFIDENEEIDKLKETHEKIRTILIDNGNVEYGDCIIDEICETVGIETTSIYYEE